MLLGVLIRAQALAVEQIDETVSVVVDAVAALRRGVQAHVEIREGIVEVILAHRQLVIRVVRERVTHVTDQVTVPIPLARVGVVGAVVEIIGVLVPIEVFCIVAGVSEAVAISVRLVVVGNGGTVVEEIKNAVVKLGTQDKMVVLGSAALTILFFLPWYSWSFQGLGVSQSNSVSGLRDVGFLGFLGTLATLFAALVNMEVVSLPDLRKKTNNVLVMTVLAGVGFVCGPLWFLFQSESVTQSAFGVQAGKTIFFWASNDLQA